MTDSWIALLRGINVGGRNIMPMAEVRDVLVGCGAIAVKTYIQSGNAVFEHAATPNAEGIQGALENRFGFRPHLLILTADDLHAAAAGNPFPEATQDPKTLHLSFLSDRPPAPDLEALEALAADDERFALKGQVFYLHAPSGIARSKLAASAERHLGVPATSRNWRTVMKLMDMVEARSG